MADQGPLVFTDPDNESVKLGDNVELRLGSGADANDESLGDISIRWDGTDLDVLQATANSAINLGIDGAGIDLVLNGDTAGVSATWDQSADSLLLNDNAKLVFGTGSDVTAYWDATNLIIAAAADDSVIEIGDAAATQKSFDVIVYGNAAAGADYLLWDASASALTTVGAAVIKGRANDANGIGLTLSTWTTTGDVGGTTGTPTGSVVWNVTDKKIMVFDGSAWVASAALT